MCTGYYLHKRCMFANISSHFISCLSLLFPLKHRDLLGIIPSIFSVLLPVLSSSGILGAPFRFLLFLLFTPHFPDSAHLPSALSLGWLF